VNAIASSALVLVLGLAAIPGDQSPRPGRVFSSWAGASVSEDAPPAVASPFMLFGWCSPPVESTTTFRIAEMDSLGFNLLQPALINTGELRDNLTRLDLARTMGMRCIVWDHRFEAFRTLPVESPEGGALLDSIVADYRDHPGMFGYYMGDEPSAPDFPLLAQLSLALHARDPQHPLWNNLYGRSHFATRDEWLAYTEDYATRLHPAVLCNDQYDFRRTGDVGAFVENAAGLSGVARAHGIPFWGVLLLVEHGSFRAITPGELSWQIAMLLAYGARGVGYFTYWTPPPDSAWNWQPAVIDQQGHRTPWFEVLRALDPEVRRVGELLAPLAWLGTVHAGSVPRGGTRFASDGWIQSVDGRATLAHFVDHAGHRLLFLANSDSAEAQKIVLHLSPGVTACAWNDGPDAALPDSCSQGGGSDRIDETLGPGAFRTYVLFANSEPPFAGGNSPACTARPEPSRGSVTLAIGHVGARGTLELLDAQGRRVWKRSLPPGATTMSWHGERDAGGAAAAGLYFVRVEDSSGFTVRRLTWLGAE